MQDEKPEVLTHEEVVDFSSLGVKPSDDYTRVANMLDNVVRECMYVSRSYGGIASPSAKHYYASVLFTALITKGVTLAQIMPFTPWAEKKIEHWDYASAAGIVRTMLELRIAFYYLCIEECDEAEWDCRWSLFNLHDCVSRIRLFTALESSEQVDALTLAAEDMRARIRVNSYFLSLPDKRKKAILHGQQAYLSPLEDIAEMAGVEKTLFRWLYVFLSSHVHALPMSFFRIGEERGRGLPTPVEEGYTSMCLSLACTFLVKTRDEVHDLFRDYKARADEIMARESGEAEIALAEFEKKKSLEVSEGMAVGETRVLLETAAIVVEATLVRADALEIRYRDKRSGSTVLQSTESETGSYLDLYDLYYWTIALNGEPVTNEQIGFLDGHDFAFKADLNRRTLHFKHG